MKIGASWLFSQDSRFQYVCSIWSNNLARSGNAIIIQTQERSEQKPAQQQPNDEIYDFIHNTISTCILATASGFPFSLCFSWSADVCVCTAQGQNEFHNQHFRAFIRTNDLCLWDYDNKFAFECVAAASSTLLKSLTYLLHIKRSRWFCANWCEPRACEHFRFCLVKITNLCVKYAYRHRCACIFFYFYIINACKDISPTYFCSLLSICQNKVAQRVQCLRIKTNKNVERWKLVPN